MYAARFISPTQPRQPLDGFCVVEDAQDIVQAMLELQPALREILSALPEAARRHFPDAVFHLKPTSDTGGHSWTHLVVEVRCAREVEDALERQERFELEWWEEHALSHFQSLRLVVRILD